jgi:hypothetical protein
MGVFWVSSGKPESQLTAEHEKAYDEANTLFIGVVIGVLAGHLQHVYLRNKISKDLWDALNNDYDGSDAGVELYIIEQYHNYKMVDGKGVVEQAHEMHCMVKKLELLKIVVPNKFVDGGIIFKLPPSWMNFVTTLKYKRTRMSISDFIASFDVEEKSQAKDGRDLKELRVKPVPTWCTSHSHMERAKASRTWITISQRKILPSRRRRIRRRMRVASCVVPLIIGQRTAQTGKEENINMRRRLRTWWLELEMELVGILIYPSFFQCFNLPLGGLILM